jgi:hypothetical protein
MIDFEEFKEALLFAEKYSTKNHVITLYATSDRSCLIGIEDRSGNFVEGAILYHNGTKWQVFINRASYLAVSSYRDYLVYCDESFNTESADELGGIEL